MLAFPSFEITCVDSSPIARAPPRAAGDGLDSSELRNALRRTASTAVIAPWCIRVQQHQATVGGMEGHVRDISSIEV